MGEPTSNSPATKVEEDHRRSCIELVPESILALDWLRLANLIRGFVVEMGCELGGSQVGTDGSVSFGMVECPETPQAQRAMVKLLGWNFWRGETVQVEQFAKEVQRARETRGVLIAPEGFSPEAAAMAKHWQIELIDAWSLGAALLRLAEGRRKFLWQVATSGEARVPSCPVCLKKLVQQEVQAVDFLVQEEECLFGDDAIVADLVYCKQLTVAQGCEVHFLQQVRANSMDLAGVVHGDLVSSGPLILRPTALVHGRVAARALQVEDGAQLLATTTVLRGDYPPLMQMQVTRQWRCANAIHSKGCAEVAFATHDIGGE